MKKGNLLLILFLITINTAFAQSNTNKEQTPLEQPHQSQEFQSKKEINSQKSTITNKTLKVDPIKLEKKVIINEPNEKAKFEEKSVQKKKSVKF